MMKTSKAKKYLFLFLAAAALVFLAWLAVSPNLRSRDNEIASMPEIGVHFIDVGQGDATLLDLGEEHVLIDGGRGSQARDYLAGKGIGKLDLLVATHPDADHIGGLDEVLGSLEVEEVWDSGTVNDTLAYQAYVAGVAGEGLSMTLVGRGTVQTFANGARLEVLSPTTISNSDLNNSSIVLRLTYGEFSYLFMGDAEVEVESALLMNGTVLDSDVLKVGHHGSPSSTSQAFAAAVSPGAAVISVGPNSYGHPSQTILDRLQNLGAVIYRTDLTGTIVLSTDGGDWNPGAEDRSGVYVIRSKNSGLVMDVYNGGRDNGTNIIQWPYHGGLNQLWRFQGTGDSYYTITSVLNPQYSIDVHGGGSAMGNRVIQYTARPWQINQKWRLLENPDGSVSFRSQLAEASGTGYLLDVYGGGKAAGVNVIQWLGHSGDNQRWYLEAR